MKLSLAKPNGTFQLGRLISENEKWEIRIEATPSGIRVRLWTPLSDDYLTDYCAGDDLQWQMNLFAVVNAIVESFPEDVSVETLRGIWPKWSDRPMSRDLKCWSELIDLSERRRQRRAS